MKFLTRLRNFFSTTSQKSKEKLSSQIIPEERISRYVLDKNHYSKEKKCLRTAAFIPAKDGKKSVYRTDNCSEDEIWDIGEKYVAGLTEKKIPLLARGDLSASTIFKEDLKIECNGIPHFRHANIIDWKSGAAMRMQAATLAQESNLILCPSNTSK